jgi:Family of unknown function (DUF5706)
VVGRRVWYRSLSGRGHDRAPVATSSSAFGWQVHAALEAWTARADVKASILLAFQGGVLLFAVTSRTFLVDGRPESWSVALAVSGVCVLVGATALAAMAVLPVLGPVRRHRHDHPDNLIYFGHVRHWQAPQLAQRLAELTPGDEMRMLSVQLVAISRLSWRKHRLLQMSVLLTMAALVVLTAAVAMPHLLATGT